MNKSVLAATVFCAQTLSFASAQSQNNVLVYLDETQPIEVRIEDALSRMTLEEKTRLSYAQSKFSSPGCSRLGIPELWMSDGPHGVRMEINWNDWGHANWTNDSCTAFPALTCLAATWNPKLAGQYGNAVAEEALYRNKHVMLGPGVNMYRTPLNGRNFEYMGEDPYLTSSLCVPYIREMQKNGVAACVKHYALNNQEQWRGHIDVELSDRALYEIYLPAFKAAVTEGGAWSIMGAYNKVRGTHATHNKLLNNDILKGEWRFDGAVISDWGAAHDTYESAMYGLDIEMGSYTNGLSTTTDLPYDEYYLGREYLKLVKEGKIPMEVVNDKAARVLRLIFRTSMNRKKPFGSIATMEHLKVGQAIAEEGIVLLKNDAPKGKSRLLPIDGSKYKSILVVGDNAIRNLSAGGGSSELKPRFNITPLEGLKEKFGADKVSFAQGYIAGRAMFGYADVIPQNVVDSLRNEAVAMAKKADLVIYIGGLNKNHFQDCEGGDRLSYNMSFGQDKMIEELLAANPNTVVVIVSGNAVAMPWIKKTQALVQSWYLGSAAGTALANVLSGDVCPSGKVPFSYPVKLSDCPAHNLGAMSYPGDSITQQYKEDILIGYRWYDTKKVATLFPFGFGLSYTSFEYGKPTVSAKTMNADGTIEISLNIKNSGSVGGKETVQLYIGDEKCSVMRPLKELKKYQKVSVASGQEAKVSFTITANDLKFFDDKKHEWVAEPGKFKAYIGASSTDIRHVVPFELK